MSYYCKSKICEMKENCARYRAHKYFAKYNQNENTQEGFASGVWYVNEHECIKNNYSERVL